MDISVRRGKKKSIEQLGQGGRDSEEAPPAG